MTKDELMEFLATDDARVELAAAEIPEEQVALVVDMYERHADRMAHYAKRFVEIKDRIWADEEPYYEVQRDLLFRLDFDYSQLDLATEDMRVIQLRQARQYAKTQSPAEWEIAGELYPYFTPLAMRFGIYVAEWTRAMEKDGILPPEAWPKTVFFFVMVEVLILTDDLFVGRMMPEELQAAIFYANAVIGFNKVYEWNDEGKEVVALYSNDHFEYIKQSKEMGDKLDALDDKFDALKEERNQLERRLNRNREIALAIRKLQTKADKDFCFRYKYQWIGVYEVMCEQHLLPDGEKSTFCRLCNSPDNREYFLPEDEDQLPNPYIPGESWDKESTWHQLSSHGDTPKQRRVIEKTKKEFFNLLREQEVI